MQEKLRNISDKLQNPAVVYAGGTTVLITASYFAKNRNEASVEDMKVSDIENVSLSSPLIEAVTNWKTENTMNGLISPIAITTKRTATKISEFRSQIPFKYFSEEPNYKSVRLQEDSKIINTEGKKSCRAC
jgi:hypothetical protein